MPAPPPAGPDTMVVPVGTPVPVTTAPTRMTPVTALTAKDVVPVDVPVPVAGIPVVGG